METAKHIVIALIMVLLTTGTAISKEASISDTRTASCIVKLTANPGILQLNYQIIDSLMHSSSVAGKAGREVLKLSPDQDYDLFIIAPLPGNPISRTQQYIDPVLMDQGRMDDPDMSEYEYGMMMQEMAREEIEARKLRESTPAFPFQPDSSRSRTGGRVTRTTTRSARRTGTPSPPTRTARSSVQSPAAVQTFLFELGIELPDDVRPLAEEFAKALVNNLRETLNNAYEIYQSETIGMHSQFADTQRRRAESRLQEAIDQARAAMKIPPIALNALDTRVYEQLEEIVDLPALRPEMTFEQVLNIIMQKVEPPLQIKPNWRELELNADIDRNTIADMDRLTGVKIRTALNVLLAGLSDPMASEYALSYIVDEGVITIATKESQRPNMITLVYETSGLINSHSLIRAIKETIEPDSWYNSSQTSSRQISNFTNNMGGMGGGYTYVPQGLTGETGNGKIVSFPGNKLSIYQTPEIHQKIQTFLQSMPIEIPPAPPIDIPAEDVLQEKQQLVRSKRNLEMGIARLDARQRAIEDQITFISHQTASKVEEDTVTAGLNRILENQKQNLDRLKLGAERGQIAPKELADAEEKIFRTKIELAQRQEQLIKSRGGDQLSRYNDDLADIMIELAEKRAEISVIDNHLNQTENQLATSSIDPRAEQIRMAKEALDRAQNRVNELNMRIANLQPPTVTVIGVN